MFRGSVASPAKGGDHGVPRRGVVWRMTQHPEVLTAAGVQGGIHILLEAAPGTSFGAVYLQNQTKIGSGETVGDLKHAAAAVAPLDKRQILKVEVGMHVVDAHTTHGAHLIPP